MSADAEGATQFASDPILSADRPAGAAGPLAVGDVVAHYRILALLGSGGMGHIHRALDLRLQREVALKVGLDGAASPERALQEARALAALNHPNVVSVYEFGVDAGRPYITMELLRGESLRARVERGAVPVDEAAALVGDALRGLAAAHEAGVVHLDLKPENLFVTAEGTLKVIDFGLARVARSTATGSDVAIGGTVSYMAPEQALGGAVDARSDLFAIGLVLVELVTGAHPYRGQNRVERLRAGERVEPPALDGLDDVVRDVARRCLAHDPDARPPGARAVLEALERRARPSAVPAPPGVDLEALAAAAHLAQKGYEVRYAPGPTLVFEGVVTPRDPDALLFPHFRVVHERAAGCGVLTLDVRALKQINSSALGLFIRWVGWINAEPEARRYRLRVVADPGVLWQRASLKPLEMIAPAVLQVIHERAR
ncbi:MAG: serine/threonine-protein kinase [Polyangiales bacterium]